MKDRKVKLLYIQPVLTSYRADLLNALNEEYNLYVLSSARNNNDGFGDGEVIKRHYVANDFIFRGVRYQRGIISYIKKIRPDVILSFANPNYISFWISLLYAKVMGIKFISHGQGLYAHQPPGIIRRIIYRLITKISDRYICYTELSKQTLISIGCDDTSLRVADNSLNIKELCIPKTKNYNVNGILFIGRIREGCGLDILIDAVKKLRENSFNEIQLHIIGDGVLKKQFEYECRNETFIHWHGKIYDEKEIADISRNCIIGCYPGNAGLSIVHYMALSLAIVVHNNLSQHMGPEVSYIKNGFNGMMFNAADVQNSLKDKISKLYFNRSLTAEIAMNGYNKFIHLSTPKMESKFIKFINEVI